MCSKANRGRLASDGGGHRIPLVTRDSRPCRCAPGRDELSDGMGSLANIERYLTAHRAGAGGPTPEDEWPRLHPFVTISRQAGAGGHSLANAILDTFARQDDTELFGEWQVFDQELCELVAQDPAFAKSLDSLRGEEYRTTIDDFFHQILQASVDQDYVMTRVFQVVRAVASIGKAVIVGRAGSQLTRGMGPAVRLRIVAPEEDRIRRLAELHHLSERKARAEARKLDESRARLLRTHFHADIDDPTEYDAVWNTRSASVEDIAASVAAVLKVRAAAWHYV